VNIRIRRGLDIRVPGAPHQAVDTEPDVTVVALQGADYPDVRPALSVEVGDRVAKGQVLFVDRHRPEITFTAPCAGQVVAIKRGPRRSLASLVINRLGDDSIEFDALSGEPTREAVRSLLLRGGLWPAVIARPFGRIADPDATPVAIFVTAMDSNPLAADPATVLAPYTEVFRAGLEGLKTLTDGSVYVCQAPGRSFAEGCSDPIRSVTFRGPHPAGLPGTHIHHLAPVGDGATVWQINYQDVIAAGILFTSGRLWTKRVISLAGPAVQKPRLVLTRIGADIDQLIDGDLKPGNVRVISGSVLSGRASHYLGRYHQQVSVLFEGWHRPDGGPLARLWSALRSPPDSTSLHGTPGALIPVDAFERVMPLRILPTPLLRALAVGDQETARRLGCLELVEEDVALLSYVCPGKIDFGPLLRNVLNDIAEGD
jgi:Na+-transporting NADH:ubiquinone oxidoreductase subunit A